MFRGARGEVMNGAREDNKSVKDELNKPIKKTIKDNEIDSIYNLLVNIYPKKGRKKEQQAYKKSSDNDSSIDFFIILKRILITK